MAIKTLKVDTKGQWVKVETLLKDTLKDNTLYSIQILNGAFLSYGSGAPDAGCFTINFTQPFTYEKKTGEDLYIKTENLYGAVLTIAE